MKKAFDQIYQLHGESIRKINMHHTDDGYDAEVHLNDTRCFLYEFNEEEKMIASTHVDSWNDLVEKVANRK